MAGSVTGVVIFGLLLALVTPTFANDPDMLQDLCVADPTSAVKVNGFTCKDEAKIIADDFFFAGIAKPGLTNNTMGSLVTGANVGQIPGLNTLGVSMARIDYAPGGLNPPHIHPRATEMIFVLQGELQVGFITTANKVFAKKIKTGETFVFPRGVLHSQKNYGKVPAAVIAVFNSQLAGTLQVAAALFTSSPPVPDDVLAQTFQVGIKEVNKIRKGLAPKK